MVWQMSGTQYSWNNRDLGFEKAMDRARIILGNTRRLTVLSGKCYKRKLEVVNNDVSYSLDEAITHTIFAYACYKLLHRICGHEYDAVSLKGGWAIIANFDVHLKPGVAGWIYIPASESPYDANNVADSKMYPVEYVYPASVYVEFCEIFYCRLAAKIYGSSNIWKGE